MGALAARAMTARPSYPHTAAAARAPRMGREWWRPLTLAVEISADGPILEPVDLTLVVVKPHVAGEDEP